jgi:di/tricarboxylate transporter
VVDAKILIGLVLAATVALFLWGRWRHDMVAAAALLVCVLAGLVPPESAFSGFSHPAVITVACVLVLSNALQQSGAIDALSRHVLPAAARPTTGIAALTALAAVLSAFMNNVGALALLMPIAAQFAQRCELPAGRVLMPIAFGSILGGMTTMIGTPPNLIVAGFRAQNGGGSFTMFDFTPVGALVAAVGVAFIALVGWHLVPARRRSGTEGFASGHYLTEARLDAGARAIGMTLRAARAALREADAQIVGLVRDDVRLMNPHHGHRLREGDILSIVAEPSALADALHSLGVRLEEDKPEEAADSRAEAAEAPPAGAKARPPTSESGDDEVVLAELAVLPQSALIGRSAADIRLRDRYGVNLLAVSRQDQRPLARLRAVRFTAGDVLLMQGTEDALGEFAAAGACVPLAERNLRIPDRGKALAAAAVMLFAIGGAALGLLPAAISFALGVLVLMVSRVVPPRNIYDAVDWPVIVLLAALMPVAAALESTGAAHAVAAFLLDDLARGSAVIALLAILVVTMTLSDLMNNAATAAMMCPIALGAARQLEASADPFLMAVAIGASCAFLTPIGHQNNTLILGPGGFRFGDYWRLGLPLEVLVVAVSMPALLHVWPV